MNIAICIFCFNYWSDSIKLSWSIKVSGILSYLLRVIQGCLSASFAV